MKTAVSLIAVAFFAAGTICMVIDEVDKMLYFMLGSIYYHVAQINHSSEMLLMSAKHREAMDEISRRGGRVDE